MPLRMSMARREALRRLTRRGLLAGALLAGTVVLLAGCRQGHDRVSVENVALPDLRAMVVPLDGLGALGPGLTVSDSSGWQRNRAAADDTLDPDDTAGSLAAAGRLGGYELLYSDPRGFASTHEERPLTVSTEVELFRDEAAASAFLRNQVAIVLRMRGRTLPEGKIARVERFEAGEVGDEAAGLRAAVLVDEHAFYISSVGFRRGKLVATATVAQRAEVGGAAELRQVAATLDDRISGVATGALAEAPVELPRRKWWRAVPDPRPLTLAAKELVGRATLTHGGYFRTPVVNAYLREYEMPGVLLGGSRVFYLRTMTQAFKSRALAVRDQRYLGSARGADTIARNFLRRWFHGTFAPQAVEARPLAAPAGDTSALEFSCDVPRGRMVGVMVSVTRGRLRGTVTVLGLEPELRTQDVLALRGKLLARLASA